jgi:hypothetical protein
MQASCKTINWTYCGLIVSYVPTCGIHVQSINIYVCKDGTLLVGQLFLMHCGFFSSFTCFFFLDYFNLLVEECWSPLIFYLHYYIHSVSLTYLPFFYFLFLNDLFDTSFTIKQWVLSFNLYCQNSLLIFKTWMDQISI